MKTGNTINPAFHQIKNLTEELTVNAPDTIVWICDAERNSLFLNVKWYEVTATVKSFSNDRLWLDHLHPEDAVTFQNDFDDALAKCSSFEFQFRIKNTNAKYQTFKGVATPFMDEQSRLAAFVGSANQVLEKMNEGNDSGKNIERSTENDQLLQIENRLMRAVIDSTTSMIAVVNNNLEYILFNQSLETYTGVARDHALGRNMFAVFPSLKGTAVEAQVIKAFQGEAVHVGPSDSILKAGKYFETYYTPLKNSRDEVDAVMIKVYDCTDTVLAEKKLQQVNLHLQFQNRELQRQTKFIENLFDATIDVIAVFDKNCNYLAINQRALDRYHLNREQVIGRNILELFPDVKDSDMYNGLQKALKGEFVHDLQYQSKVLKETHFENYYIPLIDDGDDVYAVMVIAHDITDVAVVTEKVRAAYEVLEQKNVELERSNQELEQFAYVASHDLQEPIRKIATYSNKLLTRSKESLSEEAITYLTRINNSTTRMYELINGLLEYSRITRHDSLFVKTSLDVVLKEVLVDYELRIQDKKVVIQFSRLPEIEGVHVQMVQLFSNLIGNSFKFAKKDIPPVIQIASSNLTDDQKQFYKLNPKAEYLNIFYVDNGIGFDQKFADKVFELFQRLHDKSLYEGSGLGLAICKKIVSNHHGMIFAFSEEGKGSTFQIILPYSQAQFIR